MYVHRVNNGKRIAQFTCSNYTKIPCGTLCKTQHRINADNVLEIIRSTLKQIAEYAKIDKEKFISDMQNIKKEQTVTEIEKMTKKLADLKRRESELESLICRIYEDNILGKIPDERYAVLDKKYSGEQKSISEEIKKINDTITLYNKNINFMEKFMDLIEKYRSL